MNGSHSGSVLCQTVPVLFQGTITLQMDYGATSSQDHELEGPSTCVAWRKGSVLALTQDLGTGQLSAGLGENGGKQRKPLSPHRPLLKAPRPPQGWSRCPSQQRTEKEEGAEPRSPLTGLENGDQERTEAQEGAGEGTSSEGQSIRWGVQELPLWGLESQKHTGASNQTQKVLEQPTLPSQSWRWSQT